MGDKKEFRQGAHGCQSVETGMPKWESACRGLGLQWPTVAQPQPRCERSAAMVKRRIWANIAVRPCLHSSLTHNRTSPFRKWNVSDLYFCKEVHSFVIEVVHYRLMMFPHISAYLYMYTCSFMWLYNISIYLSIYLSKSLHYLSIYLSILFVFISIYLLKQHLHFDL